ncbi:MAG: hypothetical protein IH614_05485 [Desulfuromonadales bacterium]|nr:hypothetical protein [Desulfuromonadales bacterium]
MKKVTLELPVVAAVAVTRVMLGAGAALLLGDRLRRRQRRRAGWALLLTGAVTTIPLMLTVMGRCCENERSFDLRPGGATVEGKGGR